MRRLLLSALMLMAVGAYAQKNEVLNLKVEARADYQREWLEESAMDGNSGFKGKYLNILLSGNISDEFSYSYRQRLNKPKDDASFFDATDWIYLTYKKEDFSISAGKLVVGIGGYEYDAAPINILFASEYWNNIPCYQFGVNLGYDLSENDKLQLQVTQSPFRGDDMYAYSVMWYGSHDWFSTIYSVNLMEYAPGKYINYISLGNRFTFGDFTLDVDVMNRAADGQAFFGRDMSVIGELSWQPNEKVRLFGKATYDVNKSDEAADMCVMSGTEITRVGAGVEYYPLKGGKNDVRLHLAGNYTWGSNGNPSGALLDNQTFVNCGVTWRINLLSFKRK